MIRTVLRGCGTRDEICSTDRRRRDARAGVGDVAIRAGWFPARLVLCREAPGVKHTPQPSQHRDRTMPRPRVSPAVVQTAPVIVAGLLDARCEIVSIGRVVAVLRLAIVDRGGVCAVAILAACCER